MPVFYAKELEGRNAILDEDESRHLIRVLRLSGNDPVDLVDGKGNLLKGTIIDPDPKGTRVRIREVIKDHLARKFHLHIAIAPTKSPDRFEWFLEKATEIGIEEITPIHCERSERSHIRHDRSEKILLAAMKQSGRALLPKLNPMVSFGDFITLSRADRMYIAHCGIDAGQKAEGPVSGKLSWLVLIGPEGDFSPEEVEQALSTGYREISLGEAVYRTETAGIIACQLINYLHP